MPSNSLANSLLKSSFWQYLSSWLDKLIGFVSTIVLARILVPDDFGIIAAVSIVTGVFHVIATVGTERYLIRKPDIDIFDLNTGWTVNVLMKALSALGIYLLAGVVADFMHDNRLVEVLQVASISPLLSGFNNIGMVIYEKDYKYRPKFVVGFISRLIGLATKITIAIYFHSYWAFIFAEIIEKLTYTLGTFIVHPYRPRLSLTNWKQQWLFSQWILFKSIFVFVRFRIDNILLSKYLPLEALGVYTVAKEVATLPSGQIIDPIMNPLYVGLSAIHDNEALFADKIHKSLCMLFLIVIPLSLGIYVTADNLVYVILGEQWQHATPLVMILSFMLLPGSLGTFFTQALTAMGNVKLIFQFELIFGLIMIAAFIILAEGMQVADFAFLRVVIIGLNTFLELIMLTLLSRLSFFRIIGLMFVPVLSAIAMLYGIYAIDNYTSHYKPLIQLIIQVGVGAFIYLWLISSFIYLMRDHANEYQFVWKTFYLPLTRNKNRSA